MSQSGSDLPRLLFQSNDWKRSKQQKSRQLYLKLFSEAGLNSQAVIFVCPAAFRCARREAAKGIPAEFRGSGTAIFLPGRAPHSLPAFPF